MQFTNQGINDTTDNMLRQEAVNLNQMDDDLEINSQRLSVRSKDGY